MKILAIRGANLASLAGEFEIDLTRSPFAESGVFAIVGNTGAGKSTLLDALCVALFDRTPRLTNHSRVIVGRGDDDPSTLGAHDARTLLRRGASAGYAEVDFEAGDLRKYRARWSVRRARNQTDGTLQDQQMSLVSLDGSEKLSGTKTETLKAIASRLGLSFDQFRRSALLAQNDFAAFLRADGRDRSELLERMTGTEIYTRLSIAAHLRASLAEARLKETRAAALAIPILDGEARVMAESDAALADDVKRAARGRLDAAELAARWLAEETARREALAAAEADHAAATAAMAGAESARAELALRRRAEQLRPIVDAITEHGSIEETLTVLDRSLAGHEVDRAAQVAARALIAADHQAAQAVLSEAQRKAQAFGDKRVSLDVARKAEDEARLRVTDAARLLALVASAQATHAKHATIEARVAELAVTAARDAESVGAAEAARDQATLLRTERARQVEQLREIAGYAHARTELRDGEPCPLCGAEEHPWRERGAMDRAIAAAEATLAEALAALAKATTELAALAARAEQRAIETSRLADERAVVERARTEARRAWRDQLSTTGELVLDDDPGAPAASQLAKDREAAAAKQLEAARAARAQAEAAAKAAGDAQAQVALAQLALDQAAARQLVAERAIAELDAAAQRSRGERDGRRARRDELAATLSLTADRWRPLAGTPDRHSESLLACVLAIHAEHGARRGSAESSELEAPSSSPDGATRRRARRSSQGDEREAELVELAATHDLDALLSLLADPSRADQLAARLATLDADVLRTRAIAGERAQLVAAHAATRPPEAELVDAASLDRIRSALASAELHASSAIAVLAADDDARRRRAEALSNVTADEQRVEIDRVLGAAIGSHDGKLFRSFAQSLTLDALLAVANAHLEELAPRYQLERIPRHDLEIQIIDRDLGAEVRSVQSLSGGESFLVSLALALGLSSMSAQDVRVRTLLIDEGFGTLDPTSLDSALGVLDALQATGRQIGVISHVPALIERVGAHVRVVQRGGGRSDVVVRA
jgi:exonuclease SbcC